MMILEDLYDIRKKSKKNMIIFYVSKCPPKPPQKAPHPIWSDRNPPLLPPPSSQIILPKKTPQKYKQI
jgi:hypothetical protein